ncbi:MAG: glycosyltransferase family 2 protein [Proteobacteria bacterium]|nr:glycosyltransferase family 2 protein [Pseudomonadota bacterium]MCL2307235.1 glycosyltransferase family 2 protein [Pseudomonadota bacterium]
MKPQLSILLVAHNQAAYLPETLASLRAQTIGLDNLEVVLIDDASTDATGELIDAFSQECPFAKVKHVSFRNVGKTRNEALALATAPYLMFVDGDDILAPNACELLLKAVQEKPAELVVTALSRFRGALMPRRVEAAVFSPISVAVYWEELLRHQRYMGHLTGCLFSRRLFETLRFPEMVCYEDIFIAPDLLHQSPRILISRTPIYFYRQHVKSLSTALNDAKAKNMLRVLAKLKESVRNAYQQRLFESLCVKQCRILLDNVKDLSQDSRSGIRSLMEAIAPGTFLLSPRVRISRKILFVKNKKELQR